MSDGAVVGRTGSVALADSRRLTGPSLLLADPGVILDVTLTGVDVPSFAAAWEVALDRVLAAVGWTGARRAWRGWPGGASLAFAAPLDVLYAATEVNEWAFAAARAAVEADAPAAPEFAATAERLRAAIAAEHKPAWRAMDRTATRRGVTFLWDDQRCSVGLGCGSLTWPAEALPASPRQVPWAAVHDIPCALVTGTNGKSTTVRLLGAITRAAGRVAGTTSTDRVEVGDEVVAVGDYSGPNGARTVLRDRRVEVGVLEVARGGILRRGLPVGRARAAVVTNVANDHLGEYGIVDVDALADAKLVVARAVDGAGRVVLNADDPRLLARGLRLAAPVLWFTLDGDHPVVAEHAAAGGDAAVLTGDTLELWHGGARTPIAAAADVPLAFGGAARHNLANALAAIGAAYALGLSPAHMREGLTAFASSPELNPGRANLWRFGDVTAIVDFAHNPHGLAALAGMAAALPARRRGIVIGQAGDRDDDAIREFVAAAWSMRPARVFIKELAVYLRGREPGVVPALIEAALREQGAEPGAFVHYPTELDAVRAALAWAADGDLLLLTTHSHRDDVIALMRTLEAAGWRAGEPLP